ncbi:hypothetical protein ABZT29_32430 [Streptomyces prasinus]
MRQLVAARPGPTAFLLPAYAPELNPVEGVWAQRKRRPANLTTGTVDRLETLVRNRLKSRQYRPATLDGFMTETELGLPPALNGLGEQGKGRHGNQHLEAPRAFTRDGGHTVIAHAASVSSAAWGRRS